jgi:outer membrane receptor protein involved in Fe transport
MAAYTRSEATSNAVFDPNSAQPLQVLDSFVPVPWNAPNRLIAWAYLPLPRKDWAFSVLTDMRSGFPYSVRDQTGIVTGNVDSYRYPLNFDLNLAIERMVILRGYRFALRAGVDNLTNQANPTAVNNVTGTPQFLRLLGEEGRHYVMRIRFFGRAGK